MSMLNLQQQIISAMRVQAEIIGPRFVSWVECGEYLINCRFADGKYEWRKVLDAAGRNVSIISEQTAEELLIVAGRNDLNHILMDIAINAPSPLEAKP